VVKKTKMEKIDAKGALGPRAFTLPVEFPLSDRIAQICNVHIQKNMKSNGTSLVFCIHVRDDVIRMITDEKHKGLPTEYHRFQSRWLDGIPDLFMSLGWELTVTRPPADPSFWEYIQFTMPAEIVEEKRQMQKRQKVAEEEDAVNMGSGYDK